MITRKFECNVTHNPKVSIIFDFERWNFFSNIISSSRPPKNKPEDCPHLDTPGGYFGNPKLVNQVSMEEIIDKAKRFQYNDTSALIFDFKTIIHNFSILKKLHKGITHLS